MLWLNWPLLDKGYLGHWPTTPKVWKNCSNFSRKNFALTQSRVKFLNKLGKKVQWTSFLHEITNQPKNCLHFRDQNFHIRTRIDSTQQREKDIDKDYNQDGVSRVLRSKSWVTTQENTIKVKKIVLVTKTSDGQNVQNHSRTHMPKTT